MPGIVGLLTKKPREWAEAQVRQMVACIRHEPFYETGTWEDESMGVYVGWAALKNSFSAAMPVCNERSDIVLVFGGEEYSDPKNVRRLKECGHSFRIGGADYLVHLYEEDPTFPKGLNGRFHGVLLDRQRGTTMLFNDRYGLQRIYFRESSETFYFSAEAKAILAVCPEVRSADTRGVGELVACGCVLQNRTLFEHLYLLPPASVWTFRNGEVTRKGKYFDPREWEEQSPLEPEIFYRELREVFTQNLPRYFEGPGRIGMSLTGGLDTRMIMAWRKSPPLSLPCYSFGGMFRDSRDVSVGRQVARSCEQKHEVIPVGKEFLSSFAHYAERSVYLTDGCIDVVQSPDLYVNEMAAKIAPVRMTGNCGDEVLRRLRVFKPGEPAAGVFSPEFLSHVRATRSTYTGLLQGNPLTFAVFRQPPWHHYGLLALEQTQLTLRSPYLDNDFVRTVYRAPDAAFASNDVRLRLIGDGNPVLRQIRTDRGFGGNPGAWGTFLCKFHHFTMRAEYAYDYGMPQWLAKVDHVFSPLHVECVFLGRHKFTHFRIWYRTVLSKYVREMLLDSRTLSRPYFEKKGIESIVHHHLKGDRNYTTEIHKVLTLELIHRLLLDS